MLGLEKIHDSDRTACAQMLWTEVEEDWKAMLRRRNGQEIQEPVQKDRDSEQESSEKGRSSEDCTDAKDNEENLSPETFG